MSLLLAGVKAAPPAANATATSAFQGYPGEAYPGEPTYPGGTSHVIEVRVAPPAASATASAPTPIPEVRLLPPAGSTTASAPTPVPQVKVLPPAALVNTSAPTPVPEVRMLSPPCTANASASVPSFIISPTVTPPAASATASALTPTPKVTLFGHWSVLPNGDFENGTTNSWVVGTDFGGGAVLDSDTVVSDWAAHGSKSAKAEVHTSVDNVYFDLISPGEKLAGVPVGTNTHIAARIVINMAANVAGPGGIGYTALYVYGYNSAGNFVEYHYDALSDYYAEHNDAGVHTFVIPATALGPSVAYVAVALESTLYTVGDMLTYRRDAAELYLGDANLTVPPTFAGHDADASAPTSVPEVRVLPPVASATASAPTPSLRIDTTQVAPVATTNASAPTPVPGVRLLPPAGLTNASAPTPVPGVRVLPPAGSSTASGLAPVPEVRVLPPAGVINASAPTPTLPTEGAVQPPAARADASAPVPTLSLSSTFAPPAASANASAPTPVVEVRVSPPAGSATASAPSPVLPLYALPPAGVVNASAPTPTASSSVSATVFATSCVATASAPIPGFLSLQSLNSGYLHTISTDQNLPLETGSIATARTVIATELAVPSVIVGVENSIQTVSVTTTQIEAATNADDTIDLFTTTIPQDLSLTSEGDITLYIVLQP